MEKQEKLMDCGSNGEGMSSQIFVSGYIHVL
jgi:hypothetical protein